MYNVGNEFVRRFDIMNTDEILMQLLKGQEQMQASIKELQNGQKQINKRLDNIEEQLEELKEESTITRVATNKIGEMLEEHLMIEHA